MKTYQVSVTLSEGGELEDHYVYSLEEVIDDANFVITDPNVSVDLHPCPFCGANGVLSSGYKGWFGWCSICGTEGPASHDWRKAGLMWNSRTL